MTAAQGLLHTFLLYPIPRCPCRMIMTSLNDVRIICSPFSVGTALHMYRGIARIHLHLCQHLHRLFSTNTQEPCHVFLKPNFKPVTLSPRYFGAPSYQSLEFIIKIGYVQPQNRHVNRPDKDTLKELIKTEHR